MYHRTRLQMRISVASGIAGVIALIGGAVLLVLARDNSVISSGNDSVTVVYRTPPWSQTIALGGAAVTIAFTAGLDKRYRALWILAGILIFMMSEHSIAVAGTDETIREVVGVWTVRSFSYKNFDRSHPLLTLRGPLMIRFDDGPVVADIPLGLPPWRIDGAAVIRHPVLNPPPK